MKKPKKTFLPLFYKKKPRRYLSKKQKKLLKFTLQKFLFKKKNIKSNKKFLEIGFGYGENLIHLSKNNTGKLIIGSEVYEPGIANVVEKIEALNLKNILYIRRIFFLYLIY